MNTTPNSKEQYSTHIPGLHRLAIARLAWELSAKRLAGAWAPASDTILATQPPRLCFCMRNLGGFSFPQAGYHAW